MFKNYKIKDRIQINFVPVFNVHCKYATYSKWHKSRFFVISQLEMLWFITISLSSFYFCLLPNPTISPQCTATIDPFCSPNPCFAGGTCIPASSTPLGFICSCLTDYFGDRCETYRKFACVRRDGDWLFKCRFLVQLSQL